NKVRAVNSNRVSRRAGGRSRRNLTGTVTVNLTVKVASEVALNSRKFFFESRGKSLVVLVDKSDNLARELNRTILVTKFNTSGRITLLARRRKCFHFLAGTNTGVTLSVNGESDVAATDARSTPGGLFDSAKRHHIVVKLLTH